MKVNGTTEIEFKSSKFFVTNVEEGKGKYTVDLQYVNYPVLRQAMRSMVEMIVSEYGNELFSSVCTQCGRCCQNRPIPISAKDIRNICLELDISTREFKDKYYEPAYTWNETDGSLRQVNGKCIFLVAGSTNSCHCRIYPARPEVCSSLEASMEICDKDIGKLIDELDWICLEGDAVKIVTKSGISIIKSLEDAPLGEAMKGILKLVREIEEPDVTQDQILNEFHTKLEELYGNVMREGVTADFYPTVEALSKMVENLTINDKDRKKIIDLLAEKVKRLMNFVEGIADNEGGDAISPTAAPDHISIDRMSLHPETLFVSGRAGETPFHHLIQYNEKSELLALVRNMLACLLQFKDPVIWEALWHKDLKCFCCGECCRGYKVEITPGDIERIAGHFNLSEKEAREKYITPSIFSWNRAAGLLGKKSGAQSGTDFNDADCIFLENNSDEVALCSIYECRPEVCQIYTPRATLCLEMSILRKRDGFMDNIIFINLVDEVLYLYTRLIQEYKKEPPVIHLKEDKDLRAMYDSIHQLAVTIITERLTLSMKQ